MKITYAPYHRWIKPAIECPENLYGSKNSRRVISALSKIQDLNITHDIRPLDAAFLEWFIPMYEKTIGSRQNAAIHDVFATTLGNKQALSDYWCLSLYQNGLVVGGTIIGVREDRLMVVYRVYNQKWFEGTLQANPSLYTEYLVSKYAYNLGKSFISHGKDRNPYGLNANIGLATFKLSVGCTANIDVEHSDYHPQVVDTDELMVDVLILHYPSDKTITDATLITSREAAVKYAQVLQYPDLLNVHVLYRD